MSHFKVGTFTSASGGEESVNVGFKPDKVELYNQNATTGEVVRIDWFGALMGSSNELRTNVIADNGTTSDVNQEYITVVGNVNIQTGSIPSITDGLLSFEGEEGFTVKAGFVEAGDICWWAAYSSD